MGSSTRFFYLFSPPPPLLLLRRCSSGGLMNFRCLHRPAAVPCYLSSFGPKNHHFRCPSVPSSSPLIPSLSLGKLHTYRARFSVADSVSHQHHPLPEWSELLHAPSMAGYFSDSIQTFGVENDFVPNFPGELLRPAQACLALARDRPNLLTFLPRSDVELVVENLTPYLFKNSEDSVRKMRLYLGGGGGHGTGNMHDMDKATTVDLMKYLLSYVGNIAYSERNDPHNREITELSVRKLLSEIAKLSSSTPESSVYGRMQNQFPGGNGQAQRPFQQNVEMKRGDWICPRCNFMNFARNVKCLECEEARPKRQLTGGEWECPQCDFYNYGRNIVCLRCDCKRPGDFSLNSTNYGYSDNPDLQRRLAENEEKAQRWFSKVSQLDSTSDISSAIKDEDFPEIMPLRKGVNRFVVSTRKTPLERRLANPQNRLLETKTGGRLDEILGSSSESTDKNVSPRQFVSSQLSDSDAFTKKPEKPADSSNISTTEMAQGKVHETEEKEQEKKSAGWFSRVAKLHKVSDPSSAVLDEDFPEIMPERRGDNRFVVSRRKDRSLTSPAYKRRAAMEQAKDSDFVPFVPFPPGYFAKKKQPETTDSVSEASGKNAAAMNYSQAQVTEHSTQNPVFSPASKSYGWNNPGTADDISEAAGKSSATATDKKLLENEQVQRTMCSAERTTESSRNSGNGSAEEATAGNKWTGKSLEGSAVKEPDPLDMSEEAKAERWFRRVAQIKDISELSQIPDEDFPSIMPMRKGVNRFVVSKRKTPLERRLASQRYRRNFPADNSDPLGRGEK